MKIDPYKYEERWDRWKERTCQPKKFTEWYNWGMLINNTLIYRLIHVMK